MQRNLSVGFEDSFHRHLVPEQRKAVLETIAHDLNSATTLGDIVDAAQELGWGEVMGELSLGELAQTLLGEQSLPVSTPLVASEVLAPEAPSPAPIVEAELVREVQPEEAKDEEEDEEDEDEDEEDLRAAPPAKAPAKAKVLTKATPAKTKSAAKAKAKAKAKAAAAKVVAVKPAVKPVVAKPVAKKMSKKAARQLEIEEDDLQSFFPIQPLFEEDPPLSGKKASKRAKKAAMYVPSMADETEAMNLDQAAKLLLPIVKRMREATMQDLEEQTGMGRRKLRFHIGQLVKNGRLKRHGMGRGTCYTVAK